MVLTAVEILKARKNLEGLIYHTPLTHSRNLSALCGAEVHMKWESLQKTGSFKPRGALNKITSLMPDELSRGIITASSGNHAIAVAFVGQMVGSKATVIMPENTPRVKVERCKSFGAKVILRGSDYDESLAYCKTLCSTTNSIYVSAFDDDKVIAGQGTIGCEILEEMPEADTIIAPVGGGGLISGISLWTKTVAPNVRVIGAQSTSAFTMYECFKAKEIVSVPVPSTIADGLAGGISQKTLDLSIRYVDEIVLAEEKKLKSAILWVLENEHQLLEGAGVVGVAAVLDGKIHLTPDEKVVIVNSGRNLDLETLDLVE
jgi:threonine dehydratase